MSNSPHDAPMLTIGEAADRARVSRKAIRVYEQRGLLGDVERDVNGYRVFDSAAVDLVAFIGAARRVGLSLDQVRTLLTATPEPPCALVRELAEQRVRQLDDQIHALTATRDRLSAIVRSPLDRSAGTCRCGLIEEADSEL